VRLPVTALVSLWDCFVASAGTGSCRYLTMSKKIILNFSVADP
jgi:hypothetical protein